MRDGEVIYATTAAKGETDYAVPMSRREIILILGLLRTVRGWPFRALEARLQDMISPRLR